jgi:NTP pyrophosphatase (non-canonical NTP hydrolase)
MTEENRVLTDQEIEAECDVCTDYGRGAMTVAALAREVRAMRRRDGTWKLPLPEDYASTFSVERALPRDQRQAMITNWAEMAFGRAEATSVPQRGLRLLEEAIEAFQAAGGDEAIAHKLVSFVFARPPGAVGQELGGVAVTVLLLASAAKLSADEEECREMHRVLAKPLAEFTKRNSDKNAAGFKIAERNACCGNVGTHGEGGREYCSTCGQEVSK